MPKVDVVLKQAAGSLTAERCLVSADVLEALNADGGLTEALADLAAGHGFQIRLRRGSGSDTLCTVKGRLPATEAGTVRMSAPGLARLGVRTGDLPAAAEADSRVLDHPPEGAFTEQVAGLGAGRDLVVITPHGGLIEQHTDPQADLLLARLLEAGIRGFGGARAWVCRGFHSGGAHRHWHITSTDISEYAFPGLKAILAPPFTYAVSFHGFGPGREGIPAGTEVWIGGGASGTGPRGRCRSEELRLLQSRIQAALQRAPGDPRVAIAPASDPLGGSDPRNIANRLSTCALQIEQSPAARETDPAAGGLPGLDYDRIARVVADILIEALRDGLVDPATGERITDPLGG